ncbi:hypothetical protein KOI35_35820 [Actinoplanes bogorensis]|uniref:Carbohydrate kinase FGGY N-terminal domain-containing protein n=1 Tax=Paractinoplanes bogorensis TaxID=1610840 RepID=A0ABS5YZP3_9ACTN|nr:FGGY family carbohydrate kinase [Actinoplanes bogorensis]MBU2668892.1 hypothetical protein [Actinoplanes bogorensis]
MSTHAGVSVGIDIGTTTIKALAAASDGGQLAVARRATPWRDEAGSRVLRADDLGVVLHDLLTELAAALPGVRAEAIGFTGLAEAGYPLDATGAPLAPAFAWFDPNGKDQASRVRAEAGPEYPGVTGLPVSDRWSLPKLAWLTGERGLRPVTWLSLPEWAAVWAGGRPVAELSLATRTGMLDVAGRRWWDRAVAWAGLPAAGLPELVTAGTPTGRAHAALPFAAGATITVAGHDHVTAMVGAGALGPGDAFSSYGTGEAVLRTTEPARDPGDLAAVVAAGATRGPHVIAGADYLMAALGSGRLQSAILDDRLGRDRTPAAVTALGEAAARTAPAAGSEPADAATPIDPAALTARLTAFDDGRAWATVVDLTARRCADALRLLGPYAPDQKRLITAGGWYGSAYIRAVRARVLGDHLIPASTEAGARGAARLAALAAGMITDLGDWPDDWRDHS